MKVKRLKLLSPLLVLALALSLMAAVVLPQTALANPADWYVSTTGSDTEGDGSPGNPWRTIQHAVDSAGVSDGDTIIVRDGTYNENVDVNKRLTIQSENGAATTIVQTPDPDEDVFTVAVDEVNISGFTVTGATGVGRAGIYLNPDTDHCNITNNIASGNDRGIYLSHASDNTISGNTLLDNNWAGIGLVQSSGNTINDNTASNTGFGMWLHSSSNNTISGNTINESSPYGIYLYECNSNTLNGNTASENPYGISLSLSSNNTIEGNTASENTDVGIYVANSSDNNTISGNIANENDNTGIYLEESSDNNIISGNTASGNNNGIYLMFSSSNAISGNTATENYHGICLYGSTGNTVSRNTASGNYFNGIWVFGSSDNLFTNNEIANNYGYSGISMSGSDNNWIIGNDILNNTGSEGSGIHFAADASGNVAHFNNIVGNSPQGSDSYGVYNEAADIVNATLNWWGDASGPSGVGPGTGDAVSDNVTFEPWLGASVVGVVAEDITGVQTGVEISGPTGSDTTLTVNTSDDVIVAVALYSGNPEEPLPDKALGKYIDIYASDPDAIVWPVYVEMSYTEDEVAAAGIDESTLGLYYWDASANEFHRCSDTGVDTATNIIWANVNEDEAGGLAGTPFAPGGAAPEPAPGGLSGGAIAGIIVGAIAGAVLIFFAVRKWVWKS